LQIVAPVFALVAIGFVWVRTGSPYDTAFVTRLATNLAIPCLIFVALARSGLDPDAAGRLLLAAATAYGAVLAATWMLCRGAGLDRRTYWAPLPFGNTGNIGLPLALFAFGEVGLGYAVVVFAVTSILTFTLGVWIVSGGGNPLRALREPMVGATLLGALFLWRGWDVPETVFRTLDLVGAMAIPLMLLTLGVAVARLRFAGLGPEAILSLLKAALCAGLAWAVGAAFGLDPVALGVLVLQLSTPVAVTSYLLAAKYGADAPSVAGLVVVSTALSVIVLPVLLAALV
jgi:predicted permease